MSFTAEEEAKIKELIAPGSLVDKLLTNQTKLNEIKETIDNAKPDIEAKKAEVKALEDARDQQVQALNEEIAALNLG
jgi:capsule polysaccharide export protein KpsE/RkpR